ncbi:MAG: leucyl aminopeptidase family protein [Fibrobacteres bacterium]|nr:leucyl aminopeptidase family protein [Fibrobacterota bacterium]
MKISSRIYEGPLQKLRTDALVVLIDNDTPLFEDEALTSIAKEVSADVKSGHLSAERIYNTPKGWNCRSVIFFSTSLQKNFSPVERIENTLAQAVQYCKNRGWLDVSILLNTPHPETARFIDAVFISQYSFTAFKSKKKESEDKTINVNFILHKNGIRLLKIRQNISLCQNLAREMVNTPANVADINFMKEHAKKIAKEGGYKYTVYESTALRKMGYNGLLTVGAGGHIPPAMAVLEYIPKVKSGKEHICLLGKGIVFDSGGISIKPAPDMWTMKGDMAGAAAVLCAMKSFVDKKPSVRVSAIVCLAENLPDSKSARPGDIFKAANGKTIHVDNTDAEGRLVLSDGLFHAGKLGATHIIDFATLTGACVVALGERIAGIMGNDDAWVDRIIDASNATGERVWRLPLPVDYRSYLDTPVADINNIGGRFGGAINGGLFLQEFVPDGIKWAHVDIAGPAFYQRKFGIFAEGATGFGVRLINRLINKE